MIRDKSDFIASLHYDIDGRKTPAYSGYRPHIEFDGIPEMLTSGQQIFIDKEAVYPGDTVLAEITIIAYQYMKGKLSVGQTFIFCEGSVKIGNGQIIEILNRELVK